jgi:hypothetical protein
MTRCKKYKARLSSSHGTKNFLHPVSLSQVSDPYVIVAAKYNAGSARYQAGGTRALWLTIAQFFRCGRHLSLATD